MTHNPREVIDHFRRACLQCGAVDLPETPLADVAEELLAERDRLAERVKELERQISCREDRI